MIAVVTGASQGLGLGVAEALARRGLQVWVTARTQARASEAVATLAERGLEAAGAALDVADDASVDAFFERLGAEGGALGVLVNNAGTIFEGTATGTLEPEAAVLARAFDNNALGAYRTMRRALPRMNAAGYGRIVNVTSGMGSLEGMGSGHAAYRVSKTALNALTRLAANEAGPGVLVNAVCPGWVRTSMGGPSATRSLDEGVSGIVWAATLPPGGPSGGLFRDGAPIPW